MSEELISFVFATFALSVIFFLIFDMTIAYNEQKEELERLRENMPRNTSIFISPDQLDEEQIINCDKIKARNETYDFHFNCTYYIKSKMYFDYLEQRESFYKQDSIHFDP